MIDPDSCDYIWLGSICDPLLNLPTKSVVSNLHLPLVQNLEPLKRMVEAMKTVLGNNFLPAIGMLGGLLLGIGFQTVIKKFGYCPVVLATGGLSCGKTTTLRSILCAMGSYPQGENYMLALVIFDSI